MNAIFNHLWQSTAFAAAIALVAFAFRRNSPRLRYWLWLAASLKFLIPFSLLVSTGSRVPIPHGIPVLHAMTVQQMSIAFSPTSALPAAHARFQGEWLAAAIWAAGALFLLVRWFRSWREMNTAAQQGRTLEPGVFGLFRPILLLPEGLAESMTEEQLQAVLMHEERHIQCFDNLTAALHMVVETLFWFHPLVWWIGARMMDERERDCDEAVLRRGSQPGAYARSIVQICQTYVESPLACASGISGSDLKKRIREIMTWRGSLPITNSARAMLAFAALTAVSLPFALGILRAQTLPAAPALTYDAVSIHKTAPGTTNIHFSPGPQGGLRTLNTSAVKLIAHAYNVEDYQVLDAPGWASSQGFDVTFTPDKSEPPLGDSPSLKQLEGMMQRNGERMKAVLHDRFGLVLRSETRELPIYNLVQAKGGHKLSSHDPSKRGPSMNLNGNGPGKDMQLIGVDITPKYLAQSLANMLHRPVVDETHLDGQYDFRASFTPDMEATQSDVTSGGSLFTSLTDQLGLKLESARGPVQVYVIEKIEQPSEN